MDALQSEIAMLKAQLGSGPPAPAPAPASAEAPTAAPAAASASAATGILADGKTYVVEGSPEAAAADLDFDLVMDKDLVANVYPAAKLDAARAAKHTSLAAQCCPREVWEQYKDKVSTGPARPAQIPFVRVLVCAARTLNATEQPRVTPSLR